MSSSADKDRICAAFSWSMVDHLRVGPFLCRQELSPLAGRGAQSWKRNDNVGGQAARNTFENNRREWKLWTILWKVMVYFINIIRSNHYLCSARRESTVLCWHHIRCTSLLRQALGWLHRRATYSARLLMNQGSCFPSPVWLVFAHAIIFPNQT